MGQHGFFYARILALLSAGVLAACGGDGEPAAGTERPREAAAKAGIVLETPAAVAGSSRIALRWRITGAAIHTVSVWLRPSDRQDFQEIATGLSGTSAQVRRGAAWRLDFPSARIRVRGCDAAGTQCIDSNEQALADVLAAGVVDLDPVQAQPSPYGGFQISRDGHTLAALRTTQMGMFGNPYENFIPAAVDVFHRGPDGRWSRTAHLHTPDISGVTSALALSGDGRTLAIPLLFSYGGSAPENVPGAIVVFARDAQHQWTQQAMLRVPQTVGYVEPHLGQRLALSADGRRLAASGSGRIHVFERHEAGAWRHASSIGPYPFGSRLALSANGAVIAVPVFEAATGDAPGRYSVHVFAHDCNCGTWSRRARLYARTDPDAGNPPPRDEFGEGGLALDHAGTTVAVGAPARGNPSAPGSVYIFGASQGVWTRRAILSHEGEPANDQFGLDLALSGNGRVLAGNACARFSAEAGVNRNYRAGTLPIGQGECHPQANPAYSHGAHVYRAGDGGAWQRAASIVPDQVPMRFPGDPSRAGERLVPVLSADAQTLAIGVFIDREPRDGTTTSGLVVY